MPKQEILRMQANRYREDLDDLLDFIYRLEEKEVYGCIDPKAFPPTFTQVSSTIN